MTDTADTADAADAEVVGDRSGSAGPLALACLVGLVAAGVALEGAVHARTAWSLVLAAVTTGWLVAAVVVVRPGGLPALGARLLAIGAACSVLCVGVARAGESELAAVLQALGIALLAAVTLHLAVALPRGRAGTPAHRVLVAASYAGAVPLAIIGVAQRPDVPVAAVLVTTAVFAVVGATAFVVTCRAAGRSDRARLQWDGWGALVVVGTAGAVWSFEVLTGWPSRPGLVIALVGLVIPLGLALSTFEPLLHRAGAVLVHTIVVVGLVVVVSTIYLVVVVGLDGMPEGSARTVMALSLLAGAGTALAAVPARRRLVEFANQRVYGERVAPDTTLRTFASRMSRSVPMDELLLQLVESLRHNLELDCAEVWTGSDGTYERQVSMPTRDRRQVTLGPDELGVASRTRVVGNGWLAVWVPELLDGRQERRMRAAPIAHMGELLGFIVAERHEDAAPFAEDEDGVLADLARQVGLALHNVRLDSALQASLDELQLRNAELQASRARIVAASDEARRRIERNLHDGAQQHLVAMAVKLGLARQLLEKDPAMAEGLLVELRDDVQATVGELRELAHGIYPPLLRERGLAEALQAAVNRSPLPTTLDAHDVGRVDTEVEAAVYFCCLEAMQNAAKHAGGGSTIRVLVERVGDEIRFTVRDDGVGFERVEVAGGHGFTNMEDRVGSIGGSVEVRSRPGDGTTVTGRVPMPADTAAADRSC